MTFLVFRLLEKNVNLRVFHVLEAFREAVLFILAGCDGNGLLLKVTTVLSIRGNRGQMSWCVLVGLTRIF